MVNIWRSGLVINCSRLQQLHRVPAHCQRAPQSLCVRITMQCVRAWRSLNYLSRVAHRRAWKRSQSHTAAARLDLSGIYPPIATPFNAKEDVDYQKLEENLQKYAKIPFKGQARGTQKSKLSKTVVWITKRSLMRIRSILFTQLRILLSYSWAWSVKHQQHTVCTAACAQSDIHG